MCLLDAGRGGGIASNSFQGRSSSRNEGVGVVHSWPSLRGKGLRHQWRGVVACRGIMAFAENFMT